MLSGWEPELARLRAGLTGDRALARRVAATPAGIGLVEAGIGAARAIADTRPDAVIFVGTAGLYPGKRDSLAVGGAVVARQVSLISFAALRDQAYFPPALPDTLETDLPLRRALARFGKIPVADVACPLAITTARVAARGVATSTRCAVENLEAFAIARAARTAQLPFAAVLGLSNKVGPTAHAEWKGFADAASAAACDAVLAWLHSPPS